MAPSTKYSISHMSRLITLFVAVLLATGCRADPTPDARLVGPPQTLPNLGAAQGVTVHQGFAYIYGDADTGIIRQYVLDRAKPNPRTLLATGRYIRLTRNGQDIFSHPTGLTFHPLFGCVIGDTVRRRGVIYFIDFDRALEDGNLDHAVLHQVTDDAAVNGTRPEFVRLSTPTGPRWLIATSDYGDVNNHVRLYDPVMLRMATTTSAPGVKLFEFPCGPFVQNVTWIDEKGWLVLVQNTTPGLGWRLTVLDLAKSVDSGKAVVVRQIDLSPTDELEGFDLLNPRLAVLVSAFAQDNVRFARWKP